MNFQAPGTAAAGLAVWSRRVVSLCGLAVWSRRVVSLCGLAAGEREGRNDRSCRIRRGYVRAVQHHASQTSRNTRVLSHPARPALRNNRYDVTSWRSGPQQCHIVAVVWGSVPLAGEAREARVAAGTGRRPPAAARSMPRRGTATQRGTPTQRPPISAARPNVIPPIPRRRTEEPPRLAGLGRATGRPRGSGPG